MIVKANCKINLGLNIVRKRLDSFHDIETVFYPVGLYDTIEINASSDGRFRFTSSGLKIPGDSASNLCVKACELIREHFKIPPVGIHLHKIIPMGSGLGGGSSDGAFTLKALNEYFRLGLNKDNLKDYASRLGSDCPFFIENSPVFATERGDILEKVAINLTGLFLLIVIPNVHVSTAKAYSMIKPAKPAISLKEIISRPVSQWEGQMINDFEKYVCQRYALIGRIKELLYDKEALYSSLSGSGSAVYGLFRQVPRLEGLFPGCFVWASPQL